MGQAKLASSRASRAMVSSANGRLSILLKAAHGVVTGLASRGQEADRLDASKIADVLNGKMKQDIFTSASVPPRESPSQGLTAMVYQEEADLVELSIPRREVERCAERAA